MFNLKKKKSKLIICLIITSIIFLWWYNRPTLRDIKNCEPFDGHDGRNDIDDVRPIYDSPFTEVKKDGRTSENSGKEGVPGNMDRDWDEYIQKSPDNVADCDSDVKVGDKTGNISPKYVNQFDKIERNGREDIDKKTEKGAHKILCKRPVSVAGMGAFNTCPALTNSTTCGKWNADFDYWCRREVGNEQDDEYSIDNPSHKVWGRKFKYEGGCNNTPLSMIWGGGGRAVCERGWSDGKVVRPYSTKCELWTDIGYSEFPQYLCRETYDPKKNDAGGAAHMGVKPSIPPSWKQPSHELWGKADRYNGGCADSRGRVQCGKGWYGGKKLVPFSTACDEPTSWGGGIGELYGSRLNSDCARYSKEKCPDAGVTADKCWGVKKVYQGGCPESMIELRNAAIGLGVGGGVAIAASGPFAPIAAAFAGIAAFTLGTIKLRRASCGVGYYSQKKVPKNSTICKRWETIDDIDCRYYAGGKIKNLPNKNGKLVKKRVSQPCKFSVKNLSQHAWGVKRKDGSSCNYGFGRGVCAKGYSNGEKLLPFSSNCYAHNTNTNYMCRDTYGSGWEADKDAHKRDSRVWKSGLYNGGCPRTAIGAGNKTCTNRNNCVWGCSRAVCRQDTTPIGTKRIAWFGTNGRTMGDTLAGTSECGSRVGFSPKYICQDAFGPDYDFVEEKGCAWLNVGVKAVCQRNRGTVIKFTDPPTPSPPTQAPPTEKPVEEITTTDTNDSSTEKKNSSTEKNNSNEKKDNSTEKKDNSTEKK